MLEIDKTLKLNKQKWYLLGKEINATVATDKDPKPGAKCSHPFYKLCIWNQKNLKILNIDSN